MPGSVLADIPFDGKRRIKQTVDGFEVPAGSKLSAGVPRVERFTSYEVVYGKIDRILHTAGFQPQGPKDSSRPNGEAD